ncbi:MAG TPA: hypothetical protein VG942_04080, partial [Hyphomonadaceae bacterium]|nr:hypothetical protein [Hyphomonadaceae bacterium]
ELGERDNMRRETEIAGVIVAALAFPAIEKFAPGSFDHHNIELILTLLAALCLMRMHEKPRAGAIAGLALGAATATAAESAPMLAAGLLIAGLLWLVRPKDYAPGLAWFGSGLAFSSLISFFVLVSPADWGRPVCDAMSTPFLGLGLIGGGIAVALGLAPESLTSTFARRVGASAVLSGIGGVSLALLFPECRGGGYAALNADMETLWMSQISETRSLFSLVGDNIALACATGGAALAGLVAAGLYLWRRWKKPEGWIVFGFLLAAWAILAWQIRGATFATTLAIPFGAWAIARARRNYQIKTSALRLVVFAGVAASSAAAAWASAGQVLQNQIMPRKTMVSFKTRSEDAKDCTSPAAFAPLNSLPAGVVLNQFSLGADVLLWTKHSVLAGPYHRDVTGTMTAINALRSSSQQAREIIAGSVADYVLVCPALSETMFYAHHATAGVVPEATLSMKLAEDEPPDWLKAVPLKDTPLKLYRVKR